MTEDSTISVEQKVEVVLKLLRKEDTAESLARQFGVSEQTVNRWYEDFMQSAIQSMDSGAKRRDRQERVRLTRELRRRDQEIEELEMANQILRKLTE